jgi:hypothetical protein
MDLEGEVVAETTVFGLKDIATMEALHRTRVALAALRLYTWPNDDHYKRYLAVKGEMPEGGTRSIFKFARDGSACATQFGRVGPMFPFELDGDRLKTMKQLEFPHLSRLLKADRTNIQIESAEKGTAVNRPTLDYFKIGERFLKLFIALEAVLLWNSNEPVTRNVAERTAFLLGRTAEDRKLLSMRMRELARTRGDIVHRGDTFVSQSELRYLTQVVQAVIIELLRLNRLKNYRTPGDFQSHVDTLIYR